MNEQVLESVEQAKVTVPEHVGRRALATAKGQAAEANIVTARAEAELHEANRVLGRVLRDRKWSSKADRAAAAEREERAKQAFATAKAESDRLNALVASMEEQRRQQPRTGKSEGATHRTRRH